MVGKWYEQKDNIKRLEQLVNVSSHEFKYKFLELKIISDENNEINCSVNIPYDNVDIRDVYPTFKKNLSVKSFTTSINPEGLLLNCVLSKISPDITLNLSINIYHLDEGLDTVFKAIIK